MTWWPWVSSRAYGVLEGQLERAEERADRLEARLVEMTEHVSRLSRSSHGLPEKAPKPKPQEPMPEEIRLGIDAWDDPEVRKELRAKAFARYAQTGSWDRVKAEMEVV